LTIALLFFAKIGAYGTSHTATSRLKNYSHYSSIVIIRVVLAYPWRLRISINIPGLKSKWDGHGDGIRFYRLGLTEFFYIFKVEYTILSHFNSYKIGGNMAK